MTIMLESMAVGRLGTGSTAESSHLELKKQNKTRINKQTNEKKKERPRLKTLMTTY